MMKVSIIIPNYNTWDLVERNINACLKFDDDLIDEIIVVDDCSPLPNNKNFPPKVKIIRNSNNLHYTKTVNNGLKNANGDLLILLDSDAYPTKAFVKDLIVQYQLDSEIGCIGLKTVDDKGNNSGNYMYFPSIYGLIVGQQIHSKLKRFDFRKYRKVVPFSCAVSFRKSCLEEMNYFDENFPVLDADTDLSYRIHLSKWKLILNNEIEIYHIGGGSIPKDNKRVKLFYESRWQLLNKFELIKTPHIYKKLIHIRLLIEKQIFYFKTLTGNKLNNKVKFQGRKELIEIVSNYK